MAHVHPTGGTSSEFLPLAPLALLTIHILQLHPELCWHLWMPQTGARPALRQLMGWAWAAGSRELLQPELCDQEMDRFYEELRLRVCLKLAIIFYIQYRRCLILLLCLLGAFLNAKIGVSMISFL